MYSLSMFGRMFTDGTRHEAYSEALRRTVKPGDVVLDIGTGTGLYALLARQLGARRVFALELNPLIEVGREIAAANNLDGIEFIRAMSTEITLPEKADVVVTDLRGTLPYLGQNLPSLLDAQRRHLAPGGTLIPRRDRLFAALSTSPRAAADMFDPWLRNPLGLDMSAAAKMAVNIVRGERVSTDQLLTGPQVIAEIDYHDITGFDLDATWASEVRSPGIAHGISVWFEATPLEGITYSTGPDNSHTVYGMALFPLELPTTVEVGDIIDVRLRAALTDDYLWSWNTKLCDRAGKVRAQYAQSTFLGVPLSLDALHRRSASHVPAVTAKASADMLALQHLVSGKSLGATADAVLEHFPDEFPTRSDALTRVADLASRYES